jgi:exosome complex RNA-binding protein Rrp42 (RNase PH superfamily)
VIVPSRFSRVELLAMEKLYNEIERNFLCTFNEIDFETKFSIADYSVEPVSENSTIISYNNNKVLVSKNSFLAKPYAERPFEGNLQIFIDSLQIAESESTFLRGHNLINQLTSSIERSFRQSKFLDLESLLVIPCELSWNIRIDIHILEFDSYIMDLCSFAILHSLSKTKIPATSLSENSPIIYSATEKTPKNINLFFYPFIFTFPHNPQENAKNNLPCRLLLGLSNTLEVLSFSQITESTYHKETIQDSFEFYKKKLAKILSLLKAER